MKNFVFFFLILPGTFVTFHCHAQQQSKFTFHFETSQSEITSENEKKYGDFFKPLDSLSVDSIIVLAYCDDRGQDDYNRKLSVMRAQKTKEYLMRSMRETVTLRAEGMGEVPLDSSRNDFNVQRKNNRRADVILFLSSDKNKIPLVTQTGTTPNELPKQKNLLTDSIAVGDKIILENILFEGGRRKLLPVSYKALDQLVTTLKSKPQYHIMILGHVCCADPGYDGIDNDTGVRNLSVVRANTIYNYLVKNGIEEKRLQAKGMKGDYPTGLGDYFDRRVEIEITFIK